MNDVRDTRRGVKAGASAGLIAGLVLTALMTAMSHARGADIWYGIKGAAAPFLGARAMTAGFDLEAVLLGLAAHLGVSLVWGALFGLFAARMSTLVTMLFSVGYAFIVWLGMYELVLPAVGLGSMRDDAPASRAIMFHLVFSVVLGAAFLVVRKAAGIAGVRYDRPWWRRVAFR